MSSQISKSPPCEFLRIETDRWTEPFWQHAGRGVLAAPRCGSCSTFRMPPTPYCPHCRSQDVEWVELSGQGTIYTFTVIEKGITRGMDAYIPYVPAVVELADAGGVRLVTSIVNAPIEKIAIGVPVRVVWKRIEPAYAIPQFELV